ncbi:MAG: hypothetical protein JO127_04670 [Caulobacteraceae bacterium]|nr:hypothetical protein [Caulobacteraceae bacterium]
MTEDVGRHQAARGRIARALREAIARLATTEAPADELAKAAEFAEGLLAHLPPSARTSRYQHSALEEHTWDTDAVVGAFNPLSALSVIDPGPPLVLEGRFSVAYEGSLGLVQGGLLVTGCDWAMGVAAAGVADGVVTGSLSVRFTAPAKIGALIRIEAAPDRIEGRKLFMRATASADGVVCAVAEAVFISGVNLLPDHARPKGA